MFTRLCIQCHTHQPVVTVHRFYGEHKVKRSWETDGVRRHRWTSGICPTCGQRNHKQAATVARKRQRHAARLTLAATFLRANGYTVTPPHLTADHIIP
jgi:hypothetical protein